MQLRGLIEGAVEALRPGAALTTMCSHGFAVGYECFALAG